jgi:hypothetical protein
MYRVASQLDPSQMPAAPGFGGAVLVQRQILGSFPPAGLRYLEAGRVPGLADVLGAAQASFGLAALVRPLRDENSGFPRAAGQCETALVTRAGAHHAP